MNISPRTNPSWLAVLVLLGGTLASTTCPGADGPPPVTGQVRLVNGPTVDYTLHFNRNALRASVRVGDALVALTSEGTLQRFDLPAVRWVREAVVPEPVTYLTQGEGETILAGLKDGRVCRVDPVTLELTTIARLPREPQWIGQRRAEPGGKAELVVVTGASRSSTYEGKQYVLPSSEVHDLATGKRYLLEDEATRFLLDRAGRLWLGSDRGEWGGRVTRVDLGKGTVTVIAPPPNPEPDRKAFWEGVYGFVELRDGQVWAYGGTSHMSIHSGFITRVDEANPRPLIALESNPSPDPHPVSNQPRLPITHVIEEKDGLLVFSYSDVFRADYALKSWTRRATLAIRYHWGRPDAVGSYPSVVAVHPPTRDGEPYVLATALDGYVLLDGTKTTARSLPGQFDGADVARIENTGEGLLFLPGDGEHPVWKWKPQSWETVSLAPPFEIDQANNVELFEKDPGGWPETRVLVAGESIFTVSGTGVDGGARAIGQRVGGKTVQLGTKAASLDLASSFATADGTLWDADSSVLKRFEKGVWTIMQKWPGYDGPSRLDPLKTTGPPWWLRDRSSNDLWQLSHGPTGEKPKMKRVEIREGAKSLRIDAALAWTDGLLLLVTGAGLRTYDTQSGKLTPVDLGGQEPAHPATTLARDGLGRLWIGSETGLQMADLGKKRLTSFEAVPGVQHREVLALVPDPNQQQGVIVALQSGVVVFLKATPMP